MKSSASLLAGPVQSFLHTILKSLYFLLTRYAKNHIKKSTPCHCVFLCLKNILNKLTSLGSLAFPHGLWWKTQLPQQSLPALWPYLSVVGTSQATSLRDKSQRWHCSRQLAAPISTGSALHHVLHTMCSSHSG